MVRLPLTYALWALLLGCGGPQRRVPDLDPRVRALAVVVDPRVDVTGPEAASAGPMPERIRTAFVASLQASGFRVVTEDRPGQLHFRLAFDVRACCGGGSYNGFETISTLTVSADGVAIDRVQYDSRDSAGAGVGPFPGEAMKPDSWGYWLVHGLSRSAKLVAHAASPREPARRARTEAPSTSTASPPAAAPVLRPRWRGRGESASWTRRRPGAPAAMWPPGAPSRVRPPCRCQCSLRALAL
jgi:hypothetical protein